MKAILLVLVLLAWAGGAEADPSDLFGGALIAHYVAEMTFSEVPPGGMCAEYHNNYAIDHYSQQVNRIDTSTYLLCNWFVIAAWTEEKEFCGVQFGFNDYDPGIFGFTFFDACFPSTGGLSIPSAGWPGPNEGIAFVVTGDPWSGNYLGVYWFIGYAYGYGTAGLIQLVPDPTVAQPFGGMGNCASPPEKWDAVLGGIGINMDGTPVAPQTPEPPEGACCLGSECLMLTEEECIAQGGVYLGDGVECEPVNPCDPAWACCLYGECVITTASQCEAIGGEWYEGEGCEQVTCRAFAVCCLCGDCTLMYEDECELAGGSFYPEWDTCDPNPCMEPSPAGEVRWGTIKALYR